MGLARFSSVGGFLSLMISPALTFHYQQPFGKSMKGSLFIDPTSYAKLFGDTLKAGQTFRDPEVHALSRSLRRPAPTVRVDTFIFGPHTVGALWDLAVAFDSALTTQVAGSRLYVW